VARVLHLNERDRERAPRQPSGCVPHVAVLVVNWNSWPSTIQTVQSVLSSSYEDMEVIICDNASADGSLQKLEEWVRSSPDHTRRVRVLNSGANKGYAGGNNVAWEWARTSTNSGFVLVLNNDVTIGESFVANAVAYAQRTGSDVLGFPAYAEGAPEGPDECFLRTAFGRGPIPVTDPAECGRELRPGESVSGVAVLIACSCPVQRFPEEYFLYLEDADFCQLVHRAGGQIWVQRDNPVLHQRSSTVGPGSPRQIYYTRRNKLHFVRRYQSFFDYATCLVRMTGTTLTGMTSSLLRMRFRHARAYVQALVDHLRGVWGRTWMD